MPPEDYSSQIDYEGLFLDLAIHDSVQQYLPVPVLKLSEIEGRAGTTEHQSVRVQNGATVDSG